MAAVLLDTHALVWWLLGQAELPQRVRDVIERADTVYVSAVSFYEIGFKRERDRQRGVSSSLTLLPDDLGATFYLNDFIILDVTSDHAAAAAILPITHGDPWDRILVAQARDLGIPLISGDRTLRDQAADTPVIW